jgi:hypothetical protein
MNEEDVYGGAKLTFGRDACRSSDLRGMKLTCRPSGFLDYFSSTWRRG